MSPDSAQNGAPELRARAGSWRRWAATVAASVALMLGASVIAPRLTISPLWAFVIGFFAISGGALAVSAALPRVRPRALFGALACGLVLLALLFGPALPPRVVAALVMAALLCGATLIGGVVGGAIEHPGHLLLVAFVSSVADAWSLLTPAGPSAAIAESPVALSVLALAWPMLGTDAIEPMLGAGDVVFAALYVAAGRAHGLPERRTLLALALAFAAALACVVWLEQPVPALPFLGVAVVAAQPRTWRLAPKDRRKAAAIAGVVVIAVAALWLGR